MGIYRWCVVSYSDYAQATCEPDGDDMTMAVFETQYEAMACAASRVGKSEDGWYVIGIPLPLEAVAFDEHNPNGIEETMCVD